MNEQTPADQPRRWRPDFTLVLLVILVLAILMVITFDLWAPGH